MPDNQEYFMFLSDHARQLARTFNLRLPIIQAPMAGVTTAAMVASACEAGILGAFGAGMLEPAAMKSAVEEIRQLTDKPFNLNLFILEDTPPLQISEHAIDGLRRVHKTLNLPDLSPPQKYAPSFSDQFNMLLELRPAMASFTFGILSAAQVAQLHDHGCYVVGTATTLDEVLAWQAVGADAICLQGVEAGGHRGMFLQSEDRGMSLLTLLAEVRAKTALPLIAAGGIMTGQAIAAAQCLGADLVQLGTAFLFCDEASIAPAYRQQLLGAQGHHTKLTRAFSGKFARGIENQFMRDMSGEDALAYPIQNALTGPLRKWAKEQDNPEYMSLWAGQGVGLGRAMPISQLVETLAAEWQQCR